MSSPSVFLCNGASAPSQARRYRTATHLEYRTDQPHDQNVRIGLTRLVDSLLHLPDRVRDLIEIAGYVFAADRLTRRGNPVAVEYHSWSQRVELIVRVRDISFWAQPEVSRALSAALVFMTGHQSFAVAFQDGHSTPATQLFDSGGATITPPLRPRVMLFSGGLDSLAGVLDACSDSAATACLISHEANNVTTHRQRKLVAALESRYPSRVLHFRLQSTLVGLQAVQETQRSRSFLYLSVAAAVAHALGQSECYMYENGFTAIALPERQDLLNARASRTSHPQTIRLMERFLRLVFSPAFCVRTPFLWDTKADIFDRITNADATELLGQSFSCSQTRNKIQGADQCGTCSQCLERRFAAWCAGAGAEDDQVGSYAADIMHGALPEGSRAMILDYLRLARDLAVATPIEFATRWVNELSAITPHVDMDDESRAVEALWDLGRRHGRAVLRSVQVLRGSAEELVRLREPGSLLSLVADQDYLRPAPELLASVVAKVLASALPVAFAASRPSNERAVNDATDAILRGNMTRFEREGPALRFGTARTVPDHAAEGVDLFIEVKYPREGTSLASLTDQLAADCVKYAKHKHVLFVIYDPHRRVTDDAAFARDFAGVRPCTVQFVR